MIGRRRIELLTKKKDITNEGKTILTPHSCLDKCQ